MLVFSLLDNVGVWIMFLVVVKVYDVGEQIGQIEIICFEFGGLIQYYFLEVLLKFWSFGILEVFVFVWQFFDWYDGVGWYVWIFLDEILLI